MTGPESGLLLDTNVVVWLLTDAYAAVPAAVVEQIEDESRAVYVSAVTYWEIAIKRSLGKLVLPGAWATHLARQPFTPIPVSPPHTVAVETLPWHHRDPFDRLLIAQSKVEGFALVTADRRLDEYGIATVWR